MENNINKNRLFWASCMALVVTAMTFAIRANLMGTIGNEFGLSNKEVGEIAGMAFLGFTIATIAGGVFVDVVGMKTIIIITTLMHLVGLGLTIFANSYWGLWISTLFVGLGNGLVEASCNPLVATIHSKEKTKMLNRFHVWFPGGIVIGGLIGYFANEIHLDWKIQIALIIIPTIVYAFLFFGQSFPKTERVQSGVSTGAMFKSLLSPLFLYMFLCMWLTASTELGTGQWIAELLGNVGVPAILLLVFINGLMAIGRAFAGPVVHRLAPTGILLGSAIFACLGLLWLSVATGYMAFAAAAVFAIGVCYFWPTMLAFVSEYVPKSGAVGMSVMGGAGMLSVYFILPFMGQFYDNQTLLAIPDGYSLEALKNAAVGSEEANVWASAKLAGGSTTLKYVAALPAILLVAFSGLFVYKKKKKQAGVPSPVTA